MLSLGCHYLYKYLLLNIFNNYYINIFLKNIFVISMHCWNDITFGLHLKVKTREIIDILV